MSTRKTDHKKHIDELIKTVRAIEASDEEQKEKTRKIRAAGERYKNAIYYDRRKFSGKNAEKRISLGTFVQYLSRARRQFEDMGLRHHLLDRELERMKKRYPHHAEVIQELVDQPPRETRLVKKKIEEALAKAVDLDADIAKIDFSDASASTRIKALASKHPMYSELLSGLVSEGAQAANDKLNKALREISPLRTDLANLKVNHEIMYVLQPNKEDKDALKRNGNDALTKKKRRVIAIDYKPYLSRITNLLTNPGINAGGHTTYSMSALAFALCAATGRRPIEVILTGEFERIDKHRLTFSGQAKKRFSEQSSEERVIYTLVDSDLVLKGLAEFRALPTVIDLVNSMPEDGDYRTANDMINNRTAPPFNQFTKEFFGDRNRVFKDTRAIYANICYTLWFDSDPTWKNDDPDVFFSKLLGHDDMRAQLHYKSIKVHGVDPQYQPKPVDRTDRLDALKKFDDQMPGFANGGAAVRLHTEVKQILEDEPNAKITQSRLYDGGKYNRGMVKRYMELCADALGIEKRENGRWYQKDQAAPPVLIEVDADDADNQGNIVGEQDVGEREDGDQDQDQDQDTEQPDPVPDKPKVGGRLLENGDWIGEVIIGTEVVTSATAKTTKMDAMREAWEKYQKELEEAQPEPKARITKEGPWWHVVIMEGDKPVMEVHQKGRRQDALDAAWADYQRLDD